MWPWSTIKSLRNEAGLLRSAVASWQERTDTKSRALDKAQGKIEVLEATLRERDRMAEQQRHDYEVMRADYTAVVALLGSQAQRPLGQMLFDQDPFKEDPKLPDQFVSPPEEEAVDGEEIMNVLETMGGETAE